MAIPTLVNKYETAWNSATTPKTVMDAVAVQAGDLLVAIVANEYSGEIDITENGTSSWELHEYLETKARIKLFTYPVTDNESLTVTATSTYGYFGCILWHFRNHGGIGIHNGASGDTTDPALTLTGCGANSAIVMGVSDWNAVSGAQAADETIGDFTPGTGYPGDGARYGVLVGYYADAGAAGNKTIGQTDPNALAWNIVGLEVLAGEASASAALTGTATEDITEADVVAGGKTIIITLTGDEWRS